VKERLIGAAVLVAAAVILIPEMLSGPKQASRPLPAGQAAGQPANSSGEPPLKTYTIDLTQSAPAPGTAVAAPAPEVVEEAAPPPENSAADDSAAPPEESSSVRAEPAVADTAAVIAATPVAAPPGAVAPPPAAETTPEPARPVVVPPPPVAAKGWAVQLGTFASQSNAASVVKDMHGRGYEAFVMPVKSAKGTLYRVRIGPMKDREAASETLRQVKASVSGAAVVAHP